MGYEPFIFCANSKHGEKGYYFDDPSTCFIKHEDTIDVNYIFVKAREYVGNGKKRILNMLDFYNNVQKSAIDYSKKHGKPDVIYASSVHPLTLVAGIKLAKKFGIECICEVRDLWPESLIDYGMIKEKSIICKLLRIGEKYIYKRADKLIFTMEGAYDYITERKWKKSIPRDKVFTVNNGVDLETFDFNKEQYTIDDEDLNSDKIKIVYTGAIRKVNNVGLILDVVKQIKDERIVFLIWGDGDELEALKSRIDEEKISNVVFKGRVDKKYIPYITSKADYNIAHNNPSNLFRFGISFNKLFDYLAAEKPVIIDFQCNYNPCDKYNASINVETNEIEKLSHKIEKLADVDNEDRAKMGDNARKAVEEEYSYEKLAMKVSKIIESKKR